MNDVILSLVIVTAFDEALELLIDLRNLVSQGGQDGFDGTGQRHRHDLTSILFHCLHGQYLATPNQQLTQLLQDVWLQFGVSWLNRFAVVSDEIGIKVIGFGESSNSLSESLNVNGVGDDERKIGLGAGINESVLPASRGFDNNAGGAMSFQGRHSFFNPVLIVRNGEGNT